MTEPVDIWGGVECTVNRVGDEYFDQLERNGHAQRGDDLERFAALGIRTLRFPLLWERIAPDGVERADWSWADERMARLQSVGIRPIVGLVHHGSGPRSTNLLDPGFGDKLAQFASAVAERYPWVDLYTPVNEPLTTARFSALYGLWYPHAQDTTSFLRALINETTASIKAMQAIRKWSPSAQMVQTEDLGRTHSTPLLAYQARFENRRRWLSLDLLVGRVDRSHPLWRFLQKWNARPDELAWIRRNAERAPILGINHYVTSERFIDERTERYPGLPVGGNGRHRYIDIEAVRVLARGADGPYKILKEAWDRYGLPIAVTEAHLGCGRAEQVRWLDEVYRAAQRLRDEGADVRGVTAWALLGTFDWHCLVTRSEGVYEPGVFDLRSPSPRPTALARLIQSYASGQPYNHPVLAVKGWWRRPERLLFPAYHPPQDGSQAPEVPNSADASAPHRRRTAARPLLITGATGTLGRAFARGCTLQGIPCRLVTRKELDVADRAAVDRCLDELKPWGVINAAGYVRVDHAERDSLRCHRENTEGPGVLADACARRRIALVTFSSDLVFDGSATAPYVESDRPAPLSTYGWSKANAEARVLRAWPEALVVRTSAFFGPWDEHNFVTAALRSVAAGTPFHAADDAVVSPTYLPDLVEETLNLLTDGESGVWHLANNGATSWFDFARQAARAAGADEALVIGCGTSDLGLQARRPRFSALTSERGILLPTLDAALDRYFADRRCALQTSD